MSYAALEGSPWLVDTSIKSALDIEWSDREQKASAIATLVEQLDRLEQWIAKEFGSKVAESPLAEPLATLQPLRQQDLEPDPPDNKPRIGKGTAVDRRVSVEDKDMRHGCKSKSKRFNRYKGRIASDLDTELILACGITAANRPEAEAVPDLQTDIALYSTRNTIAQLSIDRGCTRAPLTQARSPRSLPRNPKERFRPPPSRRCRQPRSRPPQGAHPCRVIASQSNCLSL